MINTVRNLMRAAVQIAVCAAVIVQTAFAYVDCSFTRMNFVLDGQTVPVNATILHNTEMIGIRSFCLASGMMFEVLPGGETNVFFGDCVYHFTPYSTVYIADGIMRAMSVPTVCSDNDMYVEFSLLSDVFNMNTSWNHITFTITADSSCADMYALKTIRSSTADYTDSRITLNALNAAYVRGGSYADDNFSTDSQLFIKNAPQNGSVDRVAYLKFDLSGVNALSAETAYISLNKDTYEQLGKYYPVEVYRTGSEWNAALITYNTAPELGNMETKTIIGPSNSRYKIDVTKYVNEALCGSIPKIISVAVKDASGYATRFSNSGDTAPSLVITGAGGEAGTRSVFVKEDFDEYSTEVNYKISDAENYYIAATRTLDSIDGYNAVNVDELDVYGGLLNSECDATGFFYTVRDNDRWRLIDPLGHIFFSSGVNAVTIGTTNKQRNSLISKYGDYAQWGIQVSDFLKNNLKFNTVGAWSSYDKLDSASDKLAYTPMIECASGYAATVGQSVPGVGHTVYLYNNCMPVFDPGFEQYADETVKNGTAGRKNDSNILGWMSDNELPVNKDMLDRYLTLDATIDANMYSYAVSWEWLKQMTGSRTVQLTDVTDELRENWRQFVYDRYFQVVSKSFKTNAPNHMYIGCRFMVGGFNSEGMMRAAGRYCDVLTANYYFCWTPETATMSDWAEWTDKPFIVSEAYAMGVDSGLDCYGGGWVVPTQEDRGMFYQNYTLRLLESKNCVGYHWFKFMDNDYTDKPGINKGIFDSYYNEYTALTDDMQLINSHKYGLIGYFDVRNAY